MYTNQFSGRQALVLLLILCQVHPVAAQTTDQWTWMSGDNTVNHAGVYGTKGVADPANKPGSRMDAATWIDNNHLWLFGGLGYDASGGSVVLNDLWKYDISANLWTWVSGSNTGNAFGVYGTKGVAAAANQPGARHYPVCCKDAAGNLWLFGGEGFATPTSSAANSTFMNDLWKYDITTNLWTWVSGDSAVTITGVYGTMGVMAVGNK